MMAELAEIFTDLLRRHGSMDMEGLSVLALIMIVTGAVPVPRTLLVLAGGAVFGFWAWLVILPSTTLGGVMPFLLTRHVFSGSVRQALQSRPYSRAVLHAVDEEGWRIVALMRFACPVPTVLQNYLFGLTRIGLRLYAATTFVCIMPQVLLYAYLGALGRAFLLGEQQLSLNLVVGLIGVASMAAALFLVTRKVRERLQADENI
jgi:uncharacterized membrane protein YdjX (TVP38/TMEM64 family)